MITVSGNTIEAGLGTRTKIQALDVQYLAALSVLDFSQIFLGLWKA